ncbi:hypothetical protein [Azospirillum ramasamyi]|uniref:Bro-N domain-containing protein n=1 Tax=Azospirillum ramasamyi TaxID=682998 RepID=A0A2U9SA13_9PROT|nr:hypothetical protein DM194_15875 [Azospirillum ramasamyi]
MRSDKPEAHQFQQWVTGEALPGLMSGKTT